MKKFFMIVLAVVIGRHFVTTTFAQALPGEEGEKAAVAADTDKAAADKAPETQRKRSRRRRLRRRLLINRKRRRRKRQRPLPSNYCAVNQGLLFEQPFFIDRARYGLKFPIV
jgi:hypothetical protein